MAPKDKQKQKVLAKYEGILAARKERLEMEVLYKQELVRPRHDICV